MLIAALLLLPAVIVAQSCPNGCSGRGTCGTSGVCSCFAGYTGPDCADRSCAMGVAWVDYPTADDTAHAYSECSNMGLCNRATGECSCRTGFGGIACDRMLCPNNCNGRGKCMSLSDVATYSDGLTYGSSNSYSRWDGTKIYGCVCDSGYTGYDCSRLACITGDDPLTTGQVVEQQTITCTCASTCSGNILLKFRNEFTTAISNSANAATVKAALDALSTINTVTVTMSGASICTAAGSTTTVTFITNHGNLPELTQTNTLTSTGATPTVAVATTVTGTTDTLTCNNRGLCAYATGLCTCATNFGNSDGTGSGTSTGTIPDCGYYSAAPTACPTAGGTTCNNHGTCSGANSYSCTCHDGWFGYDCSLRSCPTGYAWWDEPSADNTAHALTECSNRGTCDWATGKCVCQSGFVGEACQRLDCPTNAAGSYCNGHGTCQTLKYLATYGETNGVLNSYTYGDLPDQQATWDANKIMGCKCDKGDYQFASGYGNVPDYTGYDCSLRTCPTGDDPLATTGGKFEQQSFLCTATAGTFTLTFRQKTTASIAFNANAATVKSALEATYSVGEVTVTFSTGTAACAAGGVTVTVKFSTSLGDLPIMSGTGSGGVTLSAFTEAVAGTKDNVECSNNGRCDRSTGVCSCFPGWTSSNSDGELGSRPDCGYRFIK